MLSEEFIFEARLKANKQLDNKNTLLHHFSRAVEIFTSIGSVIVSAWLPATIYDQVDRHLCKQLITEI